jgi:hypothetical protein
VQIIRQYSTASNSRETQVGNNPSIAKHSRPQQATTTTTTHRDQTQLGRQITAAEEDSALASGNKISPTAVQIVTTVMKKTADTPTTLAADTKKWLEMATGTMATAV